jgi:hypothetical protein
MQRYAARDGSVRTCALRHSSSALADHLAGYMPVVRFASRVFGSALSVWLGSAVARPGNWGFAGGFPETEAPYALSQSFNNRHNTRQLLGCGSLVPARSWPESAKKAISNDKGFG